MSPARRDAALPLARRDDRRAPRAARALSARRGREQHSSACAIAIRRPARGLAPFFSERGRGSEFLPAAGQTVRPGLPSPDKGGGLNLEVTIVPHISIGLQQFHIF